jgi:hypothetical protein
MACCAAGAPVKLEYIKKGHMKDVASGLKAYVNCQQGSKRALILVHDIFGFHFNQVCSISVSWL